MPRVRTNVRARAALGSEPGCSPGATVKTAVCGYIRCEERHFAKNSRCGCGKSWLLGMTRRRELR